MSKSIESRKANPGERMLEVKVRFWTNEIVEGKGQIMPKHAWTSGEVRMRHNESHGIIPEDSILFNSLMELPQVIERVLIQHGIKLHRDGITAKYIK